jgi:hypothetical protein
MSIAASPWRPQRKRSELGASLLATPLSRPPSGTSSQCPCWRFLAPRHFSRASLAHRRQIRRTHGPLIRTHRHWAHPLIIRKPSLVRHRCQLARRPAALCPPSPSWLTFRSYPLRRRYPDCCFSEYRCFSCGRSLRLLQSGVSLCTSFSTIQSPQSIRPKGRIGCARFCRFVPPVRPTFDELFLCFYMASGLLVVASTRRAVAFPLGSWSLPRTDVDLLGVVWPPYGLRSATSALVALPSRMSSARTSPDAGPRLMPQHVCLPRDERSQCVHSATHPALTYTCGATRPIRGLPEGDEGR